MSNKPFKEFSEKRFLNKENFEKFTELISTKDGQKRILLRNINKVYLERYFGVSRKVLLDWMRNNGFADLVRPSYGGRKPKQEF